MSDASKLTDEQGEGGTREPAEIRADIERTRAELGETAAAVAEKADVKAQATAKVDEVKQQTSDKVQEVTAQAATKAKEAAPESAAPAIEKAQRFANEKPLVAIGAAVLAMVVLGRLLSR